MKKAYKISVLFSLTLFLFAAVNLTQQSQEQYSDDTMIPGTAVKYPGMVAEDFDNDGQDEIACDFGTSGVWLYSNNSSPKWRPISSKDPRKMISLDYDGDGVMELACDWGATPSSGIYTGEWWDGQSNTWTAFLIAGYTIDYMFRSDVDNDGEDELVMDARTTGDTTLWMRRNVAPFFYNLHQSPNGTEGALAVAFANPDDEIVAELDPGGMKWWNWAGWNDTDFSDNWTNMTTADADMSDVLEGEYDGDAEEELVVDVNSVVWLYNYSSTPQWSNFNPNEIYDIRIANIDNTSAEEMIFGFATGGMWYYSWSTGWRVMSSNRGAWDQPGWIVPFDFLGTTDGVSGDVELAADFDTSGTWLYDVQSTPRWSKITPSNPESIVAANWDGGAAQELIIDFGAAGVWLYDWASPNWRKISGSNVEQN